MPREKRTPHAPEPGQPEAARGNSAVLIVAVLLFVALRMVCAAVPLERDEGEYSYIAQRMLHGEMPYRDVFDQKPPGVFFAYLIPVALFGRSIVAIHMTMYAATALTAFFVYRIAAAIRGPRTAALAVAAFAVVTIEPSLQSLAANTEQFMILPMTASVWFTLQAVRTRSRVYWFAVGAAVAAACAFKQVAAINVLFLGMIVLAVGLRNSREWFRRTPAELLTALLGAAAVALPIAAYFGIGGAGAAAWDCIWTHNIRYAQSVPYRDGLDMLGLALKKQTPGLWLVWILTLVAVIGGRGIKPGESAFHIGWLLCSAIGVSIGFFFRAHYFIQFAPALSIAAAAGLDRLAAMLERGASVSLRTPGCVVLALLLCAPTLIARRDFWTASSNEKCRQMYFENPFVESAEIGRFVEANTRPDDTVLIFGSEPQILFFAERRSATRYIIFYPLMMNFPNTLERQKEAVEEIRRANPRVVILTNIYASLLQMPGAPNYIFRELNTALQRGYQIDGVRGRANNRPKMIFGPPAREFVNRVVQAGGKNQPEMIVFVRR